MARFLPLRLTNGQALTFNLSDPLLRLVDEIPVRARGQIELPEPVTNTATRNRYLVRSLTEELMVFSQLERVTTSRIDTKKMLRGNRRPKDRSERMIVNNLLAIKRITELHNGFLTPEPVCEAHCRVTGGVIDGPAEAERIRRSSDSRIRIVGDASDEQLLHTPPSAAELPKRLEELYAFANISSNNKGGPYASPLVHSITPHLMMGHDHYFASGSGRTARAVSYWSMFSQGLFFTEYLSISHLPLRTPAYYTRSFLYTERDEGDLTHFLLGQAKIAEQAIIDLDGYLAHKTRELEQFDSKPRTLGPDYHQIALLEVSVRDLSAITTVAGH